MNERFNGEVKWFSNQRGYGFLTRDDVEGEEYFVHFTAFNGGAFYIKVS